MTIGLLKLFLFILSFILLLGTIINIEWVIDLRMLQSHMLGHWCLSSIRFVTSCYGADILPFNLIGASSYPFLFLISIILRHFLKGSNQISKLSFLFEGFAKLHAKPIILKLQRIDLIDIVLDSILDVFLSIACTNG